MPKPCCFVCGEALVCQRSTRRYCTDACRQSAYRRRRSPRVRHHRSASPIRVPHGRRPTASLAGATVRPIPLAEAKAIVEAYEPFCLTAGALAFGLYLGPALASVVVFGPPAEANLRPRSDSIVLRRGVTLPWAPRNCRLRRTALARWPTRAGALSGPRAVRARRPCQVRHQPADKARCARPQGRNRAKARAWRKARSRQALLQ